MRTLSMTEKERTRIKTIQMAIEKKISQRAGAERLGVSERQFRRLISRYKKKGDEGLISHHRNKPSNHRMDEEKRNRIIELLKTDYEGFGGTLASEKLLERNGIHVSKETVRQIMIETGLHKPKKKKKEEPHPMRKRRACKGELVQIDGSYHAWLEGRAEKACLILFVDDATSEILAGLFVPHETYFAYGEVCKAYFTEKGMPEAFYSDKFGVFRVNHKNVTTTEAITQFGRALKELDIELICANSPQAKGRIERANETLQDRLVKEMRLEGINTYEAANEFLPKFFKIYNQKFGVQPRDARDVHRPLPEGSDLDMVFAWQTSRIISKNLEIQFDKKIYQVISKRPAYALKKRDVLVAQHADGRVSFLLNQQPLEVKEFHQQPKQAEIVDAKRIESRKPTIPAPDHPWRTYQQHKSEVPIQPLA